MTNGRRATDQEADGADRTILQTRTEMAFAVVDDEEGEIFHRRRSRIPAYAVAVYFLRRFEAIMSTSRREGDTTMHGARNYEGDFVAGEAALLRD